MKIISKLTFLLIVFALLLPTPLIAGGCDMPDCSEMMSMDMESDMPCGSDTDNDNDMNCQVQCSIISSSNILPIISVSSLEVEDSIQYFIHNKSFQSVYIESDKQPPISIL